MGSYDTVATMKTVLERAADGLNVQIAALNTAKGTTVPDVRHFEFEDFRSPDEFPDWPALQCVYAEAPSNGLKQQGKRKARRRFEWQYWTGYGTGVEGGLQTDLLITEAALMRVVDLLPDETGIDEIRDVATVVTGVQVAEEEYVVLVLTMEVMERDETP